MSTEAELSPEERERYERSCFAELAALFDHSEANDAWKLRALALEGWYPDTRIVARLWDKRRNKEKEAGYDLWGPRSPYRGYQDNIEEPTGFALLTHTWMTGG